MSELRNLFEQLAPFSILTPDQQALVTPHVSVREFGPGEVIYRSGDLCRHAFGVISGIVRVSTMNEDGREVVVDEAEAGDFFGLASLLGGTTHRTSARTLSAVTCLAIDHDGLLLLVESSPPAAIHVLVTMGRRFHSAERRMRSRSLLINPNEVVEQRATLGDQLADAVAGFGGSWRFITLFLASLIIYVATNQILAARAWDPYPFILLNLFLSMLAAVQAPIIMMSQNRQDAKDRLRSQLDYEVNQRAEAEIRDLARSVESLRIELGSIRNTLGQ